MFVVAAVLSGGACAFAQQPASAAPAPQAVAADAAQQAPAPPAASPAAVPADASAPPMTRERLQRIYHIRQLEGMFTNAVKAGASSLANQLQVSEPNTLFVTGNARARGFELEGYGIFFDVDVPTMMQSAVFAMQTLRQQQQYIDSLTQALGNPNLDPSTRRVAQSELNRIQRAMASGRLAPIPIPSAPVPPLGGTPPPQGIAVASTVDAAAAPVDPNDLYTETIKGALVDAMLSYGSALRLADNEWLTVAARATSQAAPGGLDDSSSIVLRIKGSDLNAFLTGKISREDAVKRIETKES